MKLSILPLRSVIPPRAGPSRLQPKLQLRLSTNQFSSSARSSSATLLSPRRPSGWTTATLPRICSNTFWRSFHPSRPRHDVFFVAFPALKSGLLSITRFSLLFLPFVFRYKLWQKYKKTSYALIQLPIFAICVVLALGLDQSPRTGRWRLLLMSEHEEMAWSRRKQQEVLRNDGPLILSEDDERCKQVSRVTTKLVTALEEQDHHIIHGASWPPRSQELSRVIAEREAQFGLTPTTEETQRRHVHYKPSGTAHSTFMPFRPATSNPLKKLESADWNLYVVDLPQMNAFALPSKDIFVYTGLLSTLPEGDHSLLAAVLAHEIAHVTQRHSVENLGFLNIAAVAFDVLRGITFALTISFPMITDSAGLFINWVNDVVAERAYSRKLEQEADAVGLEIMATAGYDPRAAQDLWELMRAVEADAEAAGQAIKVENKFAMLRTHPTSEARQEALAKDMPAALKIWRDHIPKRPAFNSPSQPQVQKGPKESDLKEAQGLAA
ncbi:uncharacterized protein I303_107258 [Kwoniella dejecticola CBS 10117]|uniref:Metalloendopeptidase n=1 Tax=Kwoniella dejecticola CBS 10117 TaxID=1296121 RepID=A0A1A5ZZ62_9TREE|nr:metalloendopeptidase [Kwoniella dejecticola CBS 10117]OBR83101.1 metalloendopeptidase [Kwoniella dejecticola CBS 10117]